MKYQDYRELAPVSSEAWSEMEERLMEVFRTYLSARKVVDVEGPKGFNYNVITEGRLANVGDENSVKFGTYDVLPLTESRVEFEMSRWELDNVMRGAKDVDYAPLEEAAQKIALFEEKAIYKGIEDAFIKGLIPASEHESITFGNDEESIMDSISKAIIKLNESFQVTPFVLVVGDEAYNRILSAKSAYPLDRRIEELIGHKIVYSHVVDGAILVPFNHEDLELTIGQDMTLGYQNHDNENVRFFIAESFTFRVLDPTIIVNLTI